MLISQRGLVHLLPNCRCSWVELPRKGLRIASGLVAAAATHHIVWLEGSGSIPKPTISINLAGLLLVLLSGERLASFWLLPERT